MSIGVDFICREVLHTVRTLIITRNRVPIAVVEMLLPSIPWQLFTAKGAEFGTFCWSSLLCRLSQRCHLHITTCYVWHIRRPARVCVDQVYQHISVVNVDIPMHRFAQPARKTEVPLPDSAQHIHPPTATPCL